MGFFDRFKKMSGARGKKSTAKEPPATAGVKPADAGDPDETALRDKKTRIARLTPREHELYLLLLQGNTLKESARRMSIQYSTANTHMSALYRKLGVKSRVQLILDFHRTGV